MDRNYDEAVKAHNRIMALAEEANSSQSHYIERACDRADSIIFRIKRTGKATDSELADLRTIAEELYRRRSMANSSGTKIVFRNYFDECAGLYEDIKNEHDEIPFEGLEYANSVIDKAVDIMIFCEKRNNYATEAQRDALANMLEGLRKWTEGRALPWSGDDDRGFSKI